MNKYLPIDSKKKFLKALKFSCKRGLPGKWSQVPVPFHIKNVDGKGLVQPHLIKYMEDDIKSHTMLNVVYRYCFWENTSGLLQPWGTPSGILQSLQMPYSLECVIRNAAGENPGHDQKLRSKMLQILNLKEYPHSKRTRLDKLTPD